MGRERESAPSIIPSCSRRRHTPSRHFPHSHAVDIRDNVEKDWQDWGLEQQLSVGVRQVRLLVYLFEATSNANSHSRNGSSGPRIATLRDTTQPDPPARQHISDDEDEEESGRDQAESWFAGGERRSAFIVFST